MNDATTTIGPEWSAQLDRRTHIDRLNQNLHGESVAWLPNAARWHPAASQIEPVVAAEPAAETEEVTEEEMVEVEAAPPGGV